MDFNNQKEFYDAHVINDLKGISIGIMDFDNPKVYGDTSIFDGPVLNWSQTTGWTKHHLQLGQTSWEPSGSLCGPGDSKSYVHQQTRTAGRFKANEHV